MGLGSRYTVRQLLGMWRRARRVARLRDDLEIDEFCAVLRGERW